MVMIELCIILTKACMHGAVCKLKWFVRKGSSQKFFCKGEQPVTDVLHEQKLCAVGNRIIKYKGQWHH